MLIDVTDQYASFNCNYIWNYWLDVGIVNVFVFHANWERLYPDFNTRAFGHCEKFLGGKVTVKDHQMLIQVFKKSKKAFVLKMIFIFHIALKQVYLNLLMFVLWFWVSNF